MNAPGNPGNVRTGVGAPETGNFTLWQPCESVDPDVPLGKKCSRFLSGISRISGRFPYNSNTGSRPTRFPTPATTDRQPAEAGHQRPATGGRERPAGRQRATFGSEPPARPERRSSAPRAAHTDDQPEAGACPPTRKAGRMVRPEGGPLPSGAVPGSAAGAARTCCRATRGAVVEGGGGRS